MEEINFNKMTFRQENAIRKCLWFPDKRKTIYEYSKEVSKPWSELTKDEASDLLNRII